MICWADDCETEAKYLGLCGKHYKRMWRHGNVNTIAGYAPGQTCSVEGCDKPVRANDMCQIHRARMYRRGTTHDTRAPNGAGTITTAGYRLLPVDGGRVYEHILVAEKALGRKLPYKAVVHHMNGKPADNFTPFNLVICPDQAYHMLLHRRAKELGITW